MWATVEKQGLAIVLDTWLGGDQRTEFSRLQPHQECLVQLALKLLISELQVCASQSASAKTHGKSEDIHCDGSEF